MQENCRKILEGIEAREQSKARDAAFDEKVARIQENCTAATILVVTRNLSHEEKLKLEKLAREIYAEDGDEQFDVKQSKYEIAAATQTDAGTALSLSNLQFDEQGREFLQGFYAEARSHEGVFQYYKSIVASLCSAISLGEDKPKDGQDISSEEEAQQMTQVINEYPRFSLCSGSKEIYRCILGSFEKRNFYYWLLT